MRRLIIRRGEGQKIFTFWRFDRPRKEIALAFANKLQSFTPRIAQHRLQRDIQPLGKELEVVGKNAFVLATL